MIRPDRDRSLPSYRVETWGCQMNVLDGQRMAGQLESQGLRRAAEDEDASVVLLNTCSVREKAEAKVFSALGTLARRKQENPELVIGVTGCVAQVSGEEILERAPWVDFVAGTGQVEAIGELVARARRERRKALELELPEEDPVYQFRQIARDSAFQAYVTVIEGCDQFCTFCIVPFTRGRERCRRSSEIVAELEHLAGSGYSEATLLGQTVNAYRDPESGTGLGALLRKAGAVPGLSRVRFLTSHPSLVDDDLVAALAEGGKLAPYFHLPAQSGSDRVLNRMKRRYTAAEYAGTVGRIRSRVPEIAISSDFIVGFPGETEDDFEATLALVRQIRFSNVFGFRYSRRPGTAAARWGRETEVPEDVSAGRLSRLLDLQAELQQETNGSLVGRKFEILVEGEDRQGHSRGRTPCNRIVHVEDGGGKLEAGNYASVRIVRGLPNSLIGTLAG
ncbi:MAG TPA: tRNA (N6-isopentenyl adenosine(37)-C2)-methylthiotransferase MiaB [Thermoanaerobaculia bacterium]|nr:tRNA (N6-isopentenyl adenosine(37)-C2)-methylthiotransferase MiaB [Thermoanaerobaculia bacterium]